MSKNSDLKKPINSLESSKDNWFKWRKFVNMKLQKEYKKIFSQLINIGIIKLMMIGFGV